MNVFVKDIVLNIVLSGYVTETSEAFYCMDHNRQILVWGNNCITQSYNFLTGAKCLDKY